MKDSTLVLVGLGLFLVLANQKKSPPPAPPSQPPVRPRTLPPATSAVVSVKPAPSPSEAAMAGLHWPYHIVI